MSRTSASPCPAPLDPKAALEAERQAEVHELEQIPIARGVALELGQPLEEALTGIDLVKQGRDQPWSARRCAAPRAY